MERILPVKPKRIVIKVGTGILTFRGYRLNKAWVKKLAAQIAVLINRNIEVILVSSGAIGAGMGMLKLSLRPKQLRRLQAAAAVGQGQLMKIYDTIFKTHGLLTAQILLTREDLSNRKRYLNAKNTLFTLLACKVIPVINENDTVSVDEIKFGDNDKLSALVANFAHADLLVILTDVEGLYAKKSLVSVVKKVSPEIEKLAAKTTSLMGTGGMASKLEAAKVCCASGIACIVANGKAPDVLFKILDGRKIGTLFLPKKEGLAAKKRWIGFSAKIMGQIFVDKGAVCALTSRKGSLLPKGIVKLHGRFAAGDTVSILDTQNQEFARGLTNYSSEEVTKIKGQKTDRIKATLGYKYYDEVVHRDNMVIL
ncbi:MAG: glutamate 5-kinase [Dehalococcoidia bacterium]|nr:MAG: glutamate 5-kinase [Dehalococcoidia bacterium]